MPTLAENSAVLQNRVQQADAAVELSRLEWRLPPLLSVIAGMVDLTGFFTLGHVFTAHVTGNFVVAAADAVHGGPFHLAQVLAIPVFMLALVGVWLIAQASDRRGRSLVSPLLLVQFLLLAAVLFFSVIARPSTAPHGLIAGVAVMIAVSAMACQYALLRLAMPRVVSTAVMTGNLTNTVLSLLDSLSERRALTCKLPAAPSGRLKEPPTESLGAPCDAWVDRDGRGAPNAITIGELLPLQR
jgi:uncharacterized membrane protein YoaK (UPF0700 family)